MAYLNRRYQAKRSLSLFRSTRVFGKWPNNRQPGSYSIGQITGYSDNLLFITPGWDLQEDRRTKMDDRKATVPPIPLRVGILP